ncbi:MAG: ubiquitin-conjugating enzyme family protein [Candidatus Odinarchaeia archaeon]
MNNILEDSAYQERLAYEAQLLEKEEPSFHPVKGDLTHWQGFIIGNGLYSDGVFKIQIKLTRSYPFEPPEVKFLTPIWHPNIDLNGRICVGILGKDWTPTLNLVGVIETIRNLLNYPNPNDPLNRDAAVEMLKNIKKFKTKVKKYILKYATWKQAGV